MTHTYAVTIHEKCRGRELSGLGMADSRAGLIIVRPSDRCRSVVTDLMSIETVPVISNWPACIAVNSYLHGEIMRFHATLAAGVDEIVAYYLFSYQIRMISTFSYGKQ